MVLRSNHHGSQSHHPSAVAIRHMYIGIAFIALVTLIMLYYNLGGSLDLGHVFFEHRIVQPNQQDYDEAFRLWQMEDDSVDSGHHHHHSDEGGGGRSHSHDDGVQFVLHESALGAPEFIGRNQVSSQLISFLGHYLICSGHSCFDFFNF